MPCKLCGKLGHNKRTCPNKIQTDIIRVCVCTIPWNCASTLDGKCVFTEKEPIYEKEEFKHKPKPNLPVLKYFEGYGSRPYHFPKQR